MFSDIDVVGHFLGGPELDERDSFVRQVGTPNRPVPFVKLRPFDQVDGYLTKRLPLDERDVTLAPEINNHHLKKDGAAQYYVLDFGSIDLIRDAHGPTTYGIRKILHVSSFMIHFDHKFSRR